MRSFSFLKPLVGAGVVCVVAAGHAFRSQDAGPVLDDLAAAQAQVVSGLENLATWCQENGLYRERDRCWRTILSANSDHAGARKALLYTREKDGSWRQSISYREPTTTNKQKAEEFSGRWRALSDPYIAAALKVNAEKRRNPEQMLAFAVELAPDDPRVREARGEARLANRWVL